MKEFKNKLLLLLYTVMIGSIAGVIIWSFLKVMNLGIDLFWNVIPGKIHFKYYTIVLCVLGGFIIGLWKWKFGEFPEELEEVIKKVKKEKRYPYHNMIPSLGSALFPLIIGASIGPEAGLTGIIAGLCTWVGDKLKHFFKEIKELTSIGITATLGTIFHSPIFGFVEPLEGEEEAKLPKTSKTILYLAAILSSFGTFILLKNITGGTHESISIGDLSWNKINYFYIFLLVIIGIFLGYFYFISHKVIKLLLKKIKKNTIIKCIIGGLALGIIGTILPLTMFSGEEQINIIITNGVKIGSISLIIISMMKIILTNICIETGLKGGHFFPMIFAGICMGYAMSLLLNMNPVIAMSLVTSSFLAHILKKPIAVVLLLLIIFPVELIPLMLASSIIACTFKKPKILD